MLEINAELSIPEEELAFQASRSGGPGGQNVNKVATRMTLLFDVDESPSLSDGQRATIRERLGSRISNAGILQVTSQRHRTQARNREEAMARFVELLRWALAERPERRATRPPRAARERRLEGKKQRARVKRDRSRRPDWDE